MAIANENSARSQPNSSAMGIWNTPKLARMAKLIMMIMQPPIRTGVISGARGAWDMAGALRNMRLTCLIPKAASSGYATSASACFRSTLTSWLTPRSPIVTPNKRSIRAIDSALWVMIR